MKQNLREILHRNFILVLFAFFAVSSVFYILLPTLPIYLSRSGSAETEIGVLIGIYTISSLLLRPFVGKALLKIPEKTFMIAGTLLYSSISIAYLFAPPFWPFLIVRVIQGIGYACFHTASVTLIANISPQAHRGESLSYFALAFNLSGALAPLVGMFLINRFTFTFLFLACLGLSLCALFFTSQLSVKQLAPSHDSSIKDPLFLSRKALPPSIIGFFAFFIWAALTTFFPLYAVANGVTNPGLFFTVAGAMLILGRSLGGRALDLYSREKIILPCLATYIISMVVLFFSKTLLMFILVAAIWGIGGAFLFPALVAYTLDRGGSPGPSMGTFYSISDLGMALGPMVMGTVAHSTSYSTMFLCLALVGFISLNYFHFFVREKKRPF